MSHHLRTTVIALFAALVSSACGAGDESTEIVDQSAPLTAAPFFAGDTANHAAFAVDISNWEMATSEAEMDCFWNSGVRHVIVGTQDRDIAREQLAMAVRRGMSVDAYVFIHWDGHTAAQVTEAFNRTNGFPIQRMWLDLEESTRGMGATAVIAQIQQALDTCRAQGGVECGIYTGWGFWNDAVNNTPMFADVPLWFAHYDHRTSLSDWPSERFGGWAHPTAKQFNAGPLCGMAADGDVMQVLAGPTVTVDRTPPAANPEPPAAATGLYPYNGMVAPDPNLKLLADTVPYATRYEFAVETWSGSTFRPYNTWSVSNPFVRISLPATPALVRFRVRATSAAGVGAWSDYSTFDVGHYTGTRPAPSSTGSDAGVSSSTTDAGASSGTDASVPMTSPDAGSPMPAPDAGVPMTSPDAGALPSDPTVPTGLAPDGDVLVSTAGVTMTFLPVAGATNYDVAIENLSGSSYVPYYSYPGAATSRTFYPAVHHTTYRFHVRATIAGTARAWSSYATFQVP